MRFQNAVRVYGRLGRSTRWSVPALLGASLVGGVAWGATDTTINPSVIIPALSEGKSASVGMGVGNYNGHTAVALGANFRVSASSQIRASMATGSSGGKTAVGLGASASW